MRSSFKASIFAAMKSIVVKKVETKEEMKDFVEFANKLYADCPCYVPELELDTLNTFNPTQNPGLEFSELQAFIAFNQDGRLVGRIAGIINHRANEKWQTRNVRFSFFDFYDQADIPAALLDAVAAWGKEKGMDTLQGPMGITDFDKEGMLVEDFDQPGSLNTLYNHAYYPRHMEALGFEKEVDWVQVRIQIPEVLPPRYARVAKYCKEMFGVKVRKLSRKDITRGGYGRKIFQLLNQSYASIFGFSELSDKQIEVFISQYIQLVDQDFITLVENEQKEVVGVVVTMCSLAEAVRKTHGKLFPFGWFHLLKALKWKPSDHADMLLIAVRPDYQMLGVNALFFDDLLPIYRKHGIRWAETGPQLEDNVRELTQWKPLNPTYTKRRRCYRKKID